MPSAAIRSKFGVSLEGSPYTPRSPHPICKKGHREVDETSFHFRGPHHRASSQPSTWLGYKECGRQLGFRAHLAEMLCAHLCPVLNIEKKPL